MRLTRIARSVTFAVLGAALLSAPAVTASAQNAGAQNAPESANTVDRQFVTQAITNSNQEMDRAQAQLKTSNDTSVKLLAQTVLRDNGAAVGQIAAVAKNLNLSYPQSHVETTTTEPQNASPAPAANMPNPAAPMSPRAYMQQEIQAHQQAIALFQNEIKNGGSQQLRTMASQLLPSLQSHLTMAQQYMNTGRITPVATPTPPGRI